MSRKCGRVNNRAPISNYPTEAARLLIVANYQCSKKRGTFHYLGTESYLRLHLNLNTSLVSSRSLLQISTAINHFSRQAHEPYPPTLSRS